MHDFFSPHMTEDQIRNISSLGLAHIGDGVYELLVRTWLCEQGGSTNKNLHRATVALVAAPAQARALDKILPLLTEEETAVYKRGRNTRVGGIPQHATSGEYHKATGLESLFGYLYLNNNKARINELFEIIIND